MNTLKIVVLMGVMGVLFVLVGGAIFGRQGAVFALVLAGLMNLVTYFFSDRMVLSMYGARVVTEAEAPLLYDVVRSLSTRSGIPMPKIAIIPQESPNAFATGRNPEHAVVAATEGILRLVDRDELEGILAHEIAHVVNRDILLGAITATLAAALSHLSQMAFWGGMGRRDDREGGRNPLIAILAMILAPIAAVLIQAMISRQKEFRADESGAALSGKPLALASALQKLEAASHRVPLVGNPATSHLFIVNPFAGGLSRLFSTHPPTEQRIARLREMATGGLRPR
ncbi:MAG: zinc metalloprotease HtpX [Thermoanaerobaculia bacterium]